MIYLAHVDPLRKDMITQADFLKRSHKEVGIREPLVILKSNERKKFKQYGCIDDYTIYNRYIAVIEHIKNNNLQNETICVLDCDMFFQKQYTPILIGDNDIVTQKWIGSRGWPEYWRIFQSDEFNSFKQSKDIDLDNPIRVCTPYYMKGSVYLNLYKLALRAESIIRKKTNWWMTEQLCISFCIACLNLNVIYENLGLVDWMLTFKDENINGLDINNYPLLHYSKPIDGINKTQIKKYNMHDHAFMLNEIDKFVKSDKPATEWDKRILDFYIKMYGYKGTT